MAETRPAKKSETLEIRLPHAAKTAFMAHCQAGGETASEAVRGFIERRLAHPAPRRSRSRLWQMTAAAAAGLALGAVAAPSLARPAASEPADFERLDRNGDGLLTPSEFARRLR